MFDKGVLREWVGWFVLVSLGVLFLTVHFAIGYAEIVFNNTLYVGFALTGLLSIGLVFFDAWLSQKDLRPDGIFRIATWCLVTTSFTLLIGVVLALYDNQGISLLPQFPVFVTNIGTAGAVIGAVAGDYDRRRISATNELQSEKERTKLLNEQITVLNRILRHDLRNDINVIQGHAELIKYGSVDPAEGADSIMRRADDIISLSESARKFEQIIRTEQPKLEVADLTDIVDTYADDVRNTRRDVEITVDRPDTAPVQASPLVKSAVRNVIDNAIDHNDKPIAQVDIAITRSEAFVTLSVSDNGPGLPERELQIIQGGTETPLDHSSGLGLWITHWIVTKSGGWIEHEPNEPRGSTIQLVFPRGNQ
jgi:signal transduction histidine kinase